MNAINRSWKRVRDRFLMFRVSGRGCVVEPLKTRVVLAAFVAHWVGGSGNWSDPAHWDIGVVPNNSGGDTYTAVVDLAGSNPIVTVDQDISIDGLTNSEAIRVTAATSSVLATIANTGTIEVSGTGKLNLAGNFTTANVGAVYSTGGTINITGTLDNTGTTLALDATHGSLTLYGGTIKGGTITAAGGAQLILRTGTLDSVTLGSDFTVQDSTQLTVKNGLTLDDARLTLTSGGGGFSSQVIFNGTQTLGGTGDVFFGGTTGGAGLYANGDGTEGGAATLTIGPGITVHGVKSGSIVGNRIFDRIINRGAIVADSAGETIGIATGTGVFINEGTIRAQDAGTVAVNGAWRNGGSMEAIDTGVLNLGGAFKTSDLGAIHSAGGAVNITGMLDNTNSTFALNPTTGSWGLARSGTIKGGVVTATEGAQLVQSGVTLNGGPGTLDGVTLNADVTLTDYFTPNGGLLGGGLYIVNGLVLNGTLTLLSAQATAQLTFSGTQTLSGTGQIVFAGTSDSYLYSVGIGTQLTIGSGITIRGTQNGHIGISPGESIVVLGNIEATTGVLIDLNGGVRLDGLKRIASQPTGRVSISGDVLGSTQNADQFTPKGTTLFDGTGTVASPQLLEVMGRDLGTDSAGFNRHFVYGTLALANGTRLKLVDQSDNATGTEAEALYVNSLVVPAGTTLDLNGLHVYARSVQVGGTVVGGSISQIADSGPISLGQETAGAISALGELDDWAFFGRSGRPVTVAVNPGGSNSLTFAEVLLLNASGDVLARANNDAAVGQPVTLSDVLLSKDETYHIQVHGSPGHTDSIGSYTVTVWDSTPDVSPLVINQQVNGLIENPYSVDRWTFSAAAGQQVRFDLVNVSGPGIAFTLTGPAGWTGFSDLTNDSNLVTLPSSGAYTLTAHGTGGQYGNAYAFRLQETALADLTLVECAAFSEEYGVCGGRA